MTLLLAKDLLVLSSRLSLSPDRGFALAHCAAPSLGLSFPQHTEQLHPIVDGPCYLWQFWIPGFEGLVLSQGRTD